MQTINLKKKYISVQSELDSRTKLLHSDLRHELCEQAKIQEQLLDPNNSLRSQQSTSEDPDNIELDNKILRIERKLDENRERIFQGIMSRDDLVALVDKMDIEMKEHMDESKPLMDKLNRSKAATQEATRRIMAVLGELSMYQRLSLKLETERKGLLQSLENGVCPDDDRPSEMHDFVDDE